MAELKLERTFDSSRRRHYINGKLVVRHCHHYATLFTQLALDAKDLVDGTKILKEVAEDVFFEVLSDYFKKNGITTPGERMDIASQMVSAIGMGQMVIVSGDENGGEIDMLNSYVDKGWLKKWGTFKTPINFIGSGYISAVFSAVFEKPCRTYNVTETQSMVMGAEKSHFKVTA